MKPFTKHITLPEELARRIHRCQIYLSITPADYRVLRIAILQPEVRYLLVPTGEVLGPKVVWLSPLDIDPSESLPEASGGDEEPLNNLQVLDQTIQEEEELEHYRT